MPTGYAYRPAPGTHVVCPSKSSAPFNKAIQIGCINIGQAKCPDRFVTLVISKNEKDIGFISRL